MILLLPFSPPSCNPLSIIASALHSISFPLPSHTEDSDTQSSHPYNWITWPRWWWMVENYSFLPSQTRTSRLDSWGRSSRMCQCMFPTDYSDYYFHCSPSCAVHTLIETPTLANIPTNNNNHLIIIWGSRLCVAWLAGCLSVLCISLSLPHWHVQLTWHKQTIARDKSATGGGSSMSVNDNNSIRRNNRIVLREFYFVGRNSLAMETKRTRMMGWSKLPWEWFVFIISRREAGYLDRIPMHTDRRGKVISGLPLNRFNIIFQQKRAPTITEWQWWLWVAMRILPASREDIFGVFRNVGDPREMIRSLVSIGYLPWTGLRYVVR